jgi:hypothetical protein
MLKTKGNFTLEEFLELPDTETKTRQSFPFCLLPSALCLLLYIKKDRLFNLSHK